MGELRFTWDWRKATSARIRLLVVAHTVRADGTEIRLISARRATRAEQRQYVERLRR